MPAVLGIYARESGEGLVFPLDEYTATDPAPTEPEPDPVAPPPRRPSLKVVK
jgi:stringent starvation protein B